jgi:hypothetical protein
MSEACAIVVPTAEELYTKASDWPTRAEQMIINSDVAFQHAGHVLTGIKGLRKEIEETFGQPIKDAHKLHKALVAKRKEFEAPLNTAERVIKQKMAAYHQEQERIRREAEEARQRAAEEARRREEERRLAEAAALEAEGHTAEADALIEEPIEAPPAPAARPAPKAEGVSFRTTWSAEITDPEALAAFVVANWGQYEQLIQFNTAELNAMARAQKDGLQLPGVKAVATQQVASRAS